MRDLREDFVNRERLSSRDLYGKRVGRALKPNQAMRVETLLPKLQIPLDITRQQSPTDWFVEKARPVFLEIGFGAGEHLAELAQRHRDVNFIGVEYYLNGVAKLLEYIDRFDLKTCAFIMVMDVTC